MDLFYSDNGISPARWGPHLWYVIHILALNFPLTPTKQQSSAYYAFFQSLCTLLPCGNCRKEFCKLVKSPTGPYRITPELFAQSPTQAPGSARRRVFKWSICIHRTVTKRIKKKTPRFTVTQWMHLYARERL